MCVEKLICKAKILCNGSSVVFSGLGYGSPTIQYLALVVKASGLYTVTLKHGGDAIAAATKEGAGEYEFVVLKGFELSPTGIYTVEVSVGEIVEINMASLCLCRHDEC